MRKALIGALALGLSTASTAHSAVLWAFEETAAGVVGTLSGTFDVSAGTYRATEGPVASPVISAGSGMIDKGFRADWYAFSGTALGSFGTGWGFPTMSWSASGAQFGITEQADGEIWVGVGEGFQGGALSGTITFGGERFETLGIDAGVYTAALTSLDGSEADDVTVRFTANPLLGGGTSGGSGPGGPSVDEDGTQNVVTTPVPGALPLLAGSLGAFAVLRRRRKA